jgi:hypothetical protein
VASYCQFVNRGVVLTSQELRLADVFLCGILRLLEGAASMRLDGLPSPPTERWVLDDKILPAVADISKKK